MYDADLMALSQSDASDSVRIQASRFMTSRYANPREMIAAFGMDLDGSVAPVPVKPVKLQQVQAGQAEFSMSLPGRVRAARRLELSFKVSGPLEQLPLRH